MDVVSVSLEAGPDAHHVFDDGLECLIGCDGAGIWQPCFRVSFEARNDGEEASVCGVADEKNEDERLVLLLDVFEECLWTHLEETMHDCSEELGWDA